MSRHKSPSTSSLSLAALVVASLSSAAAAIVVHEFWRAGAILGAAVTPVLVAVFNELLRRPVERVNVRATYLTGPKPVRVAVTSGTSAPVRVYRARPRWRPAIVTGMLAFVLGVAGLTASELLLERSIGDRRDRTTLFDTRNDSADIVERRADPVRATPAHERRNRTEREPDKQRQAPPPARRPASRDSQSATPPPTTTQPAERTPSATTPEASPPPAPSTPAPPLASAGEDRTSQAAEPQPGGE